VITNDARRGDRVLLRSVSYDIYADAKTPIARAVRDANYDPIVMAFNIERSAPTTRRCSR
jgi:hypothetical protein